MKFKNIIPNLITSLNLFCGAKAIIAFLFHENELGIALVILALIFDFLDGFVARLLKVSSELGKQLDSLADMVTFGVVPGIIMYMTIQRALVQANYGWHPTTEYILPHFGFLITIFSGIRLGKFNIDTRQTTSFIGLPTPANTFLILTIPLINIYGQDNSLAMAAISSLPLLLTSCIALSYLLIAELPLLSLKFKSFQWKGNELKFLLLISSVLLLWLFSFLAALFIILLYLIISIINNLIERKK